ncbi:NitT/TauT family transport system substrate-binding protein [Prosthecobacter fusiformis]|uniref:NitT/TauT family transport system substrate-binding protein n=1 Tax=Prosthecobacter fusiformis TaxID=48464 RepID=A0A4R7RQE6_9BACT|nr:ABC transporter substrate-binding protein [Prosthecobacter fusiformis]TDU67319.1 NitT/TauT family transport system substrate-binding protein [Prosthecobacter fusiformis]
MKRKVLALLLPFLMPLASLSAEPLKIGYSDWPGWVAWEIGIKKGWFKEEGVETEFVWMDYVKSMEAYAAGKLDAVCVTNGDALVTGATGKPSVAILLNDFSNGNDMIVAKPGIDSFKAMKGKTVALEEGFVEHLLLLKGLEMNGMAEGDITIKNTPTNNTPQVFASGEVDAIAAWQPNSGQALKLVPGSKPVFSSKDAPGLIYDGLFCDMASVKSRRPEWLKVVKVWYRIVAYMEDEKNLDEALAILAERVGVKPAEYEPLLEGTKILSPAAALKVWEKADGLGSIYGSTKVVDDFNVKFGVYKEPLDIAAYLDPTLTKEVLAK